VHPVPVAAAVDWELLLVPTAAARIRALRQAPEFLLADPLGLHVGDVEKLTGVVTEQDVRDLQARDDAPFFNLGLVYVFGLIGLGALRVLMIGVRNTDLYIVLTLVTVLGYLIFRVFRTFFMFQPRPDAK